MKIAVTYENGQIFQHFGHTEQFKLYEAVNGKITHAEVVDTNGSGHGALASFLMQNGVDTLICGGIGGGAQTALAEAGIKLYGGGRGRSPLYHHAMINHSNIEGACRFAGGTQHIADALAARIREHGGTILTGCRASALHTEGRRITGVELADGRILRAKSVISAIHPAATFGLIGPTPVLRRAFRDRMAGMPGTYGLFSVYLLLRPQSFPYINRNLYYYAEGGDVWDTLFDTEAMRPKMVLFSAQPPCADPAWSEVVTLMAPIATDIWSAWSGSAPGRRPEAYTALKTAVAEHLTDFVCERLPGLRAAIEQTYAATPLTYRHYTGIPHGAAYGLQKDCRNVMATCIPVRTKFENLLLTGQNLTVHGAIGVTLSAAATCAELLGTEYLAKKIGDA